MSGIASQLLYVDLACVLLLDLINTHISLCSLLPASTSSTASRTAALGPARQSAPMVASKWSRCSHPAAALFIELGLAWMLPLDLDHSYFAFTLRVFLLQLFFGASKEAGCGMTAPSNPRCGGSCLGSLRSFLTSTWRGCCC
jgi:hypothetical protein